MMTRTTISALAAALMLSGASVAYAGGAAKQSSDQTYSPARSDSAGTSSGATSGMSAGESSKSTTGATSGTTSGAAAGSSAGQMTEASVKDKLEAQGYSQVSGVKKVGDKYEAKAMKNGKSVQLEIDAATGMVKDKSS